MKVEVFSVFDSAINDFGNPFFLHHVNEAKRGFTHAVNDKTTKFNMYPEDYSLFHLGSYDSSLGQFINLTSPVNLGKASLYLNKSS